MTNASVRFVPPWSPVLVSVLLILGASPLLAQTAGPRLMFTDIESGPSTGGQNDLGPFISIYGEGFGATQGSSTVTIGGQPVTSVTSWGQDNAARSLDRIVVQPGPGAASGDIVVTVGGQASNGLPFTVRAGNIYFVDQASGNDANPGTFAQPWATLWRPRQTMVAGDIVYVIGGTFSQLDPDWPGWDTLLMLDSSFGVSGTAAAPIAYLGYPGSPPLLENAAARRGIYLNQDSGPLSYVVIGNVRFGLMEDAINVIGVGQRIVGNDLSNGGVGNKIGVFGDTSAIKILGNRLDSNGTPTTKYYCIYVQGFGVNSDVEVGWNEMRNQYGRSMQVFGHIAGDRVEDLRIHDNVMVGAALNNLILGGSDGGTEILGTVTVTGNVIAGATAEGLRVNDPQGTVVIENNTLSGNAFAQVYLERAGAGLITLRDNIVVAQAGQEYYEFDAGSSSASFVPANNLVYGAGPCAAWDTGCINEDPLFAGASDYHLQSGSPAIDAGVATPVSRDHDGIPRPQGAAHDVGAFEVPLATPSLSIADLSVNEGDTGETPGTFTVILQPAADEAVTVDWATSAGTASPGTDFASASGSLSFSPGETVQTLSVAVLGDAVDEDDETFGVALTAASGSPIADATAVATIFDDDPSPALSIADAGVVGEAAGATAVFGVSLSAASGRIVAVSYATLAGTAGPGDYLATEGTLSFAPGDTTRTVGIRIGADALDEDDESFSLVLSAPVSATVADGAGLATIADDDAPPSVAIRGASIREGQSGTRDAVFTVRLSAPSGRLVTVSYATADGTAGGSDYLARSGVVSLSPGERIRSILVPVVGDGVVEADETFLVTLGTPVHASVAVGTAYGRILDDDRRRPYAGGFPARR